MLTITMLLNEQYTL